jgi:predicted nuclease of predicted toxin-antitoxin system
MRILFDQNVPRALRNLLPGHVARTASEMGWSTLANGDLVDAAERAGFEAMITADRNFRYQVDISSRGLAVIVLSTNHWPTLQQRGAPAILRALQRARPGSYQDVAVGRFRRDRSVSPPRP